jgi:hypothetical protein
MSPVVEEEHATLGLLEAPGAAGIGAGEGLLVTKQLGPMRSRGIAAMLMATNGPPRLP